MDKPLHGIFENEIKNEKWTDDCMSRLGGAAYASPLLPCKREMADAGINTDRDNLEYELAQDKIGTDVQVAACASTMSELYDPIEESLAALQTTLQSDPPSDRHGANSFLHELEAACARLKAAVSILPPTGLIAAATLIDELKTELVQRETLSRVFMRSLGDCLVQLSQGALCAARRAGRGCMARGHRRD